MKKNIFIALAMVAGLSLTSCDLNYVPSDELSADVLLKDEGGAKYILDGCYALMKDEVEFISYASGNSYVRHFTQMTEFPADNTCLSGVTPDPLYEATAYKMTDGLKNLGTLWYLSYKAISMTNTVIGIMEEGKSTDGDQLLGEAYFLRALLHWNVLILWAKPYSHGTENPGIIMRTSTNTETTERATVGECYDAIEKDLLKAKSLMKPGVTRGGNQGYGNYEAAMGLLSRVYLFEEKWDNVINIVDEMLGGAAPDTKLTKDFVNYFANAKTDKETLFCVAHTAIENKGQASAGSMYNADGGGWGEVYPSDPLLNLYERYPSDVRYTAYIKPQVFDDTKTMVTFPVFNQNDESGRANLIFPVTPDGDGYKFDGGTVTKKTVNGEYSEWEATYGGEKIPARVTAQLKNRNNYYIYYVTKFGYQDGIPTLSSPVFLRWGEVILNRAEAYAHKNDPKAYDDVNAIRTRAGIPAEGMFAADKMHGYADMLSIVLDERRLELAFEGHRRQDIYRNKLNMDRRYPGCQPWGIVKYDDPKIQYPIPFCEYSVSGIPQNESY